MILPGGSSVMTMPRGSSVMILPRRRELKPIEAMTRQSQQVRKLADARERNASHALNRGDTHEPAQVKLDRLREPRQVVNAEDPVCRIELHRGAEFAVNPLRERRSRRVVLAHEREHLSLIHISEPTRLG